MHRIHLPLALGLLALTPTAAVAAGPQGTYSGSYGPRESRAVAEITVDHGIVTGLSINWECDDERTQATVLSNAAGVGGGTVPLDGKRRFTLERRAQMSQGAIGEPGFREGRGSAAFTMTYNGSSWKGSVRAKGLGCSTTGNFTARLT